jgi:membrane protease YdiL (CAAX protease family)
MIEGFRRFSAHLPIIWGLVGTIAGVLFSMIAFAMSFPLGALFSKDAWGRHLAEAIYRLVGILLVVLLLWQLDWLDAVGLTRLGHRQTWLRLLLLSIYVAAIAIYAYTGDFRFDLSNGRLAVTVALNMFAVGLFEEIVFRGLVMYGLVRAWGSSTRGLVGSVLLAALFFGLAHLVNLLAGKPVASTLLQSLGAFTAGIYYGAFVLSSGSLWPAIVLHGLENAAVNCKIAGQPEYQEPMSASVKMILLTLPVVAYAAYLLWMMPPLANISRHLGH